MDPKRFGKGNLGYIGMLKFFLTHNCNEYCKKLGLVNPKVNETIDEDSVFFQNKVEEPKDENQKINTLCDLCRTSFKKRAIKIFNNK